MKLDWMSEVAFLTVSSQQSETVVGLVCAIQIVLPLVHIRPRTSPLHSTSSLSFLLSLAPFVESVQHTRQLFFSVHLGATVSAPARPRYLRQVLRHPSLLTILLL